MADCAVNLPSDSATGRAVNPHWQRSIETDLLRSVDYSLRVLVWQKTEDGSRGWHQPEPIELPWDERPSGSWRGDVFEWDELADALGGDPRLKQAMGLAA